MSAKGVAAYDRGDGVAHPSAHPINDRPTRGASRRAAAVPTPPAASARGRPGGTRAPGAARGLPGGARAGAPLLHLRDARTLQLQPRDPLRGVAARPRRRWAGDKSRVGVLLAGGPRKGRAGTAGATEDRHCRGGDRRGRRGPDRRPPAARASAGLPAAARRGRVAPHAGQREPQRPAAAAHHLPQRPLRIPPSRGGRRLDQHLAHHRVAVRRTVGALDRTPLARPARGAPERPRPAAGDLQQRLQAGRRGRRVGAERPRLRPDARRPGHVRALQRRALRRDRLARRRRRARERGVRAPEPAADRRRRAAQPHAQRQRAMGRHARQRRAGVALGGRRRPPRQPDLRRRQRPDGRQPRRDPDPRRRGQGDGARHQLLLDLSSTPTPTPAPASHSSCWKKWNVQPNAT